MQKYGKDLQGQYWEKIYGSDGTAHSGTAETARAGQK